MVDVQGMKYPSSDALTDADINLMKDYTEHFDNVQLDGIDYASRKFYSVFNYTGEENVFAIPQIQVEGGIKVSSRFINFWLDFPKAPEANRHLLVYHLCKKIAVFT